MSSRNRTNNRGRGRGKGRNAIISTHRTGHSGMTPEDRVDLLQEHQQIISQLSDNCQRWTAEARREGLAPQAELGRCMRRNYEASRPNSEQKRLRDIAPGLVEKCILEKWEGRGLSVVPYGSYTYGLDHHSSDIDLILLDDGRPFGVGTPEHQVTVIGAEPSYIQGLPEWYHIDTVARVFRSGKGAHFFSHVKTHPSANVPLLRMTLGTASSAHSLDVDVVVQSRFSIENSRLIKAYCNLRPTLLPALAFTVKRWLSERGLNDSDRRETGQFSLSSYAITLLVIAFLQSRNDLPNLQNRELLRRLRVAGNRLYTDYEEPRPTAREVAEGAISSDKVIRSYNCSFYDLSGKTARRNRVRKIVDHDNGYRGFVLGRNHRAWAMPDSFDDWVKDYESLWKSKSKFRALPSPGGAGLHLQEAESASRQDEILGGALIDFLFWFDRILNDGQDGKPVIDVAQPGTMKRVHSAQERAAWQLWSTRSKSYRKRHRSPLYDADLPLEWEKHPLLIRDPFIRDRNVARNIKPEVVAQYRQELARAKSAIFSTRGQNIISLTSLLVPWQYERALKEDTQQRHQEGMADLTRGMGGMNIARTGLGVAGFPSRPM